MNEVIDGDTLLRIMPPPSAADSTADWDLMAQSWGKRFPTDYRWFMGVYGPGAIEQYLAIVPPETKQRSVSDSRGMMRESIAAKWAWSDTEKPPEYVGRSDPELIAWGVDGSADILCWDASGADPDAWPVLVYHRDDDVWRRYDCGFVAFLVRLLQGDLGHNPLGSTGLWGEGSARFMTPAEEQQLLAQGVNPWTGEPDPWGGGPPGV